MGKAGQHRPTEPPPHPTLERVSETSDEPPPPTCHVNARSDQHDVRTRRPPHLLHPPPFLTTTLAADPTPPSCPAAAQDYKGKRVVVEDHQVPWEYPWPEYAPRAFNHPSVIANGPDMPDGHKWAAAADPSLLREELKQRITYQVSHLSTSSGGSGGGGTSATPVGGGAPMTLDNHLSAEVASRPAGGRGSPTQPPSPTSPTSPTSPPLPAFAVGDRVRHKDRGVGIVAESLSDGRMPVIFEDGDTHRYKPSSLYKFALVEKVRLPEESSGFVRRRAAVLGGGLPLGQVANPIP